jgi:hypothetical protein
LAQNYSLAIKKVLTGFLFPTGFSALDTNPFELAAAIHEYGE